MERSASESATVNRLRAILDTGSHTKLGALGIALLALVTAAGCMVGFEGEDFETKYAVGAGSYVTQAKLRDSSPLWTLHETAHGGHGLTGTLDVCVFYGPDTRPSDPTVETTLHRATRNAMNAWNDVLTSDSPRDQGDFIFPVWWARDLEVNFTCHGDPDRTYTIAVTASRTISLGDPSQHRIWLSYGDLHGGLPLLTQVLTREYGHLCGLGRTSRAVQPPSIMNGSATSITADDKAGIWNVWRYMRNGGEPCGPGYDEDHGASSQGRQCIREAGEDDSLYCLVSCTDLGLRAGGCTADDSGISWECRADECAEVVSSCPTSSTGGAGSSSTGCDIDCSYVNVLPGQCGYFFGHAYECRADRCAHSVARCTEEGSSGSTGSSSSSGTCIGCDTLGLDYNECGRDSWGQSWECNWRDCLVEVSSCPGDTAPTHRCDPNMDCADWGVSVGQCFVKDDQAYECKDNGCVEPTWWCDDPAGTPASECRASNNDCRGCVDREGCGYCNSTGRCTSGATGGPDDGSCGFWDWAYSSIGAWCDSGDDDDDDRGGGDH